MHSHFLFFYLLLYFYSLWVFSLICYLLQHFFVFCIQYSRKNFKVFLTTTIARCKSLGTASYLQLYLLQYIIELQYFYLRVQFSGRTSASQAECREFDSRYPLHLCLSASSLWLGAFLFTEKIITNYFFCQHTYKWYFIDSFQNSFV